MPNRLATETSPYLLQHAYNPVDWYPWGEEALARAKGEDKPILLSIGYSACHWCHVMERESFEDPATAALMNDRFINIKVDREERPDLDSVYMRSVQTLIGRGGWPLTAFLTPDCEVFFGGTYFPPEPRLGMPAFSQVLQMVSEAYRTRRQEIQSTADQILRMLRSSSSAVPRPPAGGGESDGLGPGLLEQAAGALSAAFDPSQGGFGDAPKFPQPMTLEFLLAHSHRAGDEQAASMAIHTLRRMARGGIRDHLGGGFHRYSVDARWLVPHFEKMLYDNGLLARAYLHGFQVTGDQELLDAAVSTLDYILDDLTSPEGGFYSARDADSEGEEGLFYLWQPQEIDELLGPDQGALFRRAYDVSAAGNFEGQNILHQPHDLEALARSEGIDLATLQAQLDVDRKTLKQARAGRPAPLRDEKILLGWNTLVMRALAEAGAVLGRQDYLQAARANASFLLGSLSRDGELLHTYKDGRSRIPGFLDDYAGLGNALLTLYEATLEPTYLSEAEAVSGRILEKFWVEGEGVFYDSSQDGEQLIVRPREVMDNATPSGNSLATELFLRLDRVAGSGQRTEIALRTLRREASAMGRFPTAFGRLLAVYCRHLSAPCEITILGQAGEPEVRGFVEAAHSTYHPNRVVAGGDPASLPPLAIFHGKVAKAGQPTAYLCRDFTCGPPLRDPGALRRELSTHRRGPSM